MRADRQYYVYIMTNAKHTVLYTGVTNNLIRRVWEHKEKLVDGFTKKYHVDMLMYYETFADVREAIAREKHIKSGSRHVKVALINYVNPEWRDLYGEL
ncbi:MAG: GIY-YIG nuclease family protein [Dehalococcoidia bacterium]|nr:GIY-YIG nuclease family protein [Dehalococcoidia bacterium]